MQSLRLATLLGVIVLVLALTALPAFGLSEEERGKAFGEGIAIMIGIIVVIARLLRRNSDA